MMVQTKKFCFCAFMMLCVAIGLQAQELTVKKMEVAPMDLSASTQPRNDLNGNPCALVKVQLATAGASFEGNVIGDVAYSQGEYWVYMSAGSYMLNIKHGSFVPLFVNFRDYGINKVEGKTTYVLTLLMPQMMNVPVDDGLRYLVMTVQPAGAIVMIDGQMKTLNNGMLSVPLSAGSHSYTVACEGYQTKSGAVNLIDDRTSLSIKLESSMATLNVSCGTPTAGIFVNDQQKGTGHWSGQLAAGVYRIEARQNGYHPQRQNITLTERANETVTIPALQAIVGNLNVNYQPIDAEVWLDGKMLGVSPNIFRNIIVGGHLLEIKAKGHQSNKQTITIEENKTLSLEGVLKAGEPVPDAVKQKTHRIIKAGKYGRVNYLGQEVVPCKWSDMGYYAKEGLAKVKDQNNKWGYMDKTGKIVIPCKWTDAGDFSEGLVHVKDDSGKWGYIDKTGRLVIPCQWGGNRFSGFSEGMARVVNEKSEEGIIDKTGRVIVPCQFGVIGKYKEGLCFVSSYEGTRNIKKYIDKNGKTVISYLDCDYSDDFSEGFALAEKNKKWGFIDKTGHIAIPCQWAFVRSFTEGLAPVKDDNSRWGFIDKTGRLVIPCRWSDGCYSFNDGLSAVCDDNEKWGFIDKTGKVVIPCQWDDVDSFEDGVAWVKISDDYWRLINKLGKYIE